MLDAPGLRPCKGSLPWVRQQRSGHDHRQHGTRPAGLAPPIRGAHLLRRSLATALLRAGASMAEIGHVLRHRSPNTTEIYAKVDFQALRELAQPWPIAEGGR